MSMNAARNTVQVHGLEELDHDSICTLAVHQTAVATMGMENRGGSVTGPAYCMFLLNDRFFFGCGI